jgi:hypothetical protein
VPYGLWTQYRQKIKKQHKSPCQCRAKEGRRKAVSPLTTSPPPLLLLPPPPLYFRVGVLLFKISTLLTPLQATPLYNYALCGFEFLDSKGLSLSSQ